MDPLPVRHAENSGNTRLWISVVVLIVATAVLAVAIYIAVVVSHDNGASTSDRNNVVNLRNMLGRKRWSRKEEDQYELNRLVALDGVSQTLYVQMLYGDATSSSPSPDDPSFQTNLDLLVSTLTPDFMIYDGTVMINSAEQLRQALVAENQLRSFQRRFISDIVVLDYCTVPGGETMTVTCLETFFNKDRLSGAWSNFLENLTIQYVRSSQEQPLPRRPNSVANPVSSSPLPNPIPLPPSNWLAKIIWVQPIAEIPYGLPTGNSNYDVR